MLQKKGFKLHSEGTRKSNPKEDQSGRIKPDLTEVIEPYTQNGEQTDTSLFSKILDKRK